MRSFFVSLGWKFLSGFCHTRIQGSGGESRLKFCYNAAYQPMMVWVLKPQRRSAVVYAPDLEQPLFLDKEAVLDGGDVIPGFKITLSKLFE